MALATIRAVSLRGIAGCVPQAVEKSVDYPGLTPEERQRFIKTTGIEQRRVSSPDQCASDFCFAAAQRLIAELKWEKSEIKLVVCVTQSPDYPIPATGILLQNRLGLGKDSLAFDVNLGCSGYVYGLLIAASILNSLGRGKALLLVGDTSTKTANPRDRTVAPLFGDAGAATALEFDINAKPLMFDLNSDGSGWEAIVMRHGGFRFPITPDSLIEREVQAGVFRSPANLELDGVDVFNFGLRAAPETVMALLNSVPSAVDAVDLFVFHQANRLMNEMIRKKLKIPEEKCPYSLKEYGNTSCSSIPLTVVACCREQLRSGRKKIVLCGFGVGLSWAAVWVEIEDLVCPPIIEL